MRHAKMNRKTQETEIFISLTLEGREISTIATGIGFLDHMLTPFGEACQFGLEVAASGDLQVDGHHTAEDIGIVLGQVIARALGDKLGIRRYGYAVVPMDEALATSALDLSGRPYLVFKAEFDSDMVGDFATQLTEEFFPGRWLSMPE